MLTEDFLGQIVIVIVMTVLLIFSGAPLLGYLYQDVSVNTLAIITQVAATIFLALQLVMTVGRIPPKGTASGIEPRITSVAGAFLILAAMFLTPAVDSESIQMTSLSFIFIGTLGSILCLYWLGRSFSIMATARRLVTTGPYSIVRHPLYVCEAVFVTGLIISHFSTMMAALGLLQFLLQFRRAKYEEAILRQTFPEYEEYARRVPMLIPRFFRKSQTATSQDR